MESPGNHGGGGGDDVTAMTSFRGVGDAAVYHVVDYVISPATVVTHVAMLCLLHALVLDGGLRRRQLTVLLVGEELLVYGLWLTVDHGLRAPFAIWVCLGVYETIVKPRVRYQDTAVLLAGSDNFLQPLPCEEVNMFSHFSYSLR